MYRVFADIERALAGIVLMTDIVVRSQELNAGECSVAADRRLYLHDAVVQVCNNQLVLVQKMQRHHNQFWRSRGGGLSIEGWLR